MFRLDDLKKTRYFQDVMQDGRLETAREYISSVIEARFASKPSDYMQKLNKIEDSSVLKGLLMRAISRSSSDKCINEAVNHTSCISCKFTKLTKILICHSERSEESNMSF